RLPGQESRHRQHPVLADERPELQGGREERDQIDGRDAALQHQPAQPIFGCRKPSHGANSSGGGDHTEPYNQSTRPKTGSQQPKFIPRGGAAPARTASPPKLPARRAKSAPAVAHSPNARRNRRPIARDAGTAPPRPGSARSRST